MPSVQTSYPENMRAAVAGAQADMTPSTVISRDVESAGGIAFGNVVYQGTADKQVLDGGAGAFTVAKYVGFALRDRSALGTVANGFAIRESARIMTKGTIWAVPAQNVVAGDPVFVRPSNGALQKDDTNSAVQVPGARWDTSAVAGALAIIRLG